MSKLLENRKGLKKWVLLKVWMKKHCDQRFESKKACGVFPEMANNLMWPGYEICRGMQRA